MRICFKVESKYILNAMVWILKKTIYDYAFKVKCLSSIIVVLFVTVLRLVCNIQLIFGKVKAAQEVIW